MQQFSVSIPTESVGGIPGAVGLVERIARSDSEDPDIAPLYEDAIRDTIEHLEATGSPVVTAANRPIEQLGTTDDCGLSPFCDDTSTSRDTALAKIQARVLGTALAEVGIGAHQ